MWKDTFRESNEDLKLGDQAFRLVVQRMGKIKGALIGLEYINNIDDFLMGLRDDADTEELSNQIILKNNQLQESRIEATHGLLTLVEYEFEEIDRHLQEARERTKKQVEA